MSTKVNFNAIRPFGPTILQGQLPKDLIKILDDEATKLLEVDALAKEWDHSMHLAGNVTQEYQKTLKTNIKKKIIILV